MLKLLYELLSSWHTKTSYLRRRDSCITQFKAQGPSRTCNKSKGEEDTKERDLFYYRHSRQTCRGYDCVLSVNKESELHFEPSLDALSLRSDVRSSIKILSLCLSRGGERSCALYKLCSGAAATSRQLSASSRL